MLRELEPRRSNLDALAGVLEVVVRERQETGVFSVRRYEERESRTLKPWSRVPRIMRKAEQLGDKSNARFGVTSLSAEVLTRLRALEV